MTYCNNSLQFEGAKTTLEQIHQLFMSMAEKQQQEGLGQLPKFITLYSGYFFDLYYSEQNIALYHYQTQWYPNIEIAQQIADHYKVDFTLDYEEMKTLIYGKAIYKNGILSDTYLEDEDFKCYQYDEATRMYQFEGTAYSSDYDILRILLNRKLRAAGL
ncbi:MAG: hypothetical protein ACTHMM_13795 [Agriterribacter sp.]